MKKRVLELALFLLFTIILSTAAFAATLEVGPGKTYTTIQDAINAAVDGDTINVFPSTYNEKITISKNNLIIQSTAGAATTIINLPNSDAPGGIYITGNGNTLDSFTIRDYSDTSYESKIFRINGNNNIIKNNIIQGNLNQPGVSDQTDYGLLIYGSNNLIDSNEIYDIGYHAINVVYSAASGNTISNNNIHDIGMRAIAIDRAPSNTITNNQISNLIGGTLWNSGPYDCETWCWAVIIWGSQSANTLIDNQDLTNLPNGIVLSAAQDVIVQNSEISNMQYIGIKLSDSSWISNSLDNNIIQYNDIHNNNQGIVVQDGGVGGIGNNNLINNNKMYNDTKGLNNSDPTLINATYNWWGSSDGPSGIGPGSGDSIFGNVLYDPFYSDSALLTPAYSTVYIDDDYDAFSCAALGYSLGVNCFTTIQEGIDAVAENGIVNVAAGTYDEDLIINKALTLQGAGSLLTTIHSHHTITANDTTLDGFTFVAPVSETVITIDSSSSDIRNIDITNNVFNLTTPPVVGIYLGGASCNGKLSDITMNYNTFNGPANMECNPWKIGGWFGTSISCEVENVDFEHNTVYNCSIPINLHDEDINDILINNNTFRDTDGVIYVWDDAGENPTGVLSNFVFTNNDVDSSNTYGVGIDVFGNVFDDANFRNTNRINHNNFVGIPGGYGFGAVSILSSLTSYTLNAEYNWWGDCSGPSGAGPGVGSAVSADVDYTPWLGICINKKTDVTCKYETNNITINANVSSLLDIESIWLQMETNNVYRNITAIHVFGDNYSFLIPYSYLIGGYNVIWNIYANDTYGNTYNNSLQSFYVRNRTKLIVNPTTPDGLNNWYITEPIFTLTKDNTAGTIYYQWDALPALTYAAPFNLDDIPNAPPKESAGTLELNYWSNFGTCGNESNQDKVFYVDLTSPRFKDLTPANNSITSNPKPNISAYINEVYQSNSGINFSSVEFYVDDDLKLDRTVNIADNIDAIVWYIPTTDLAEGLHKVFVKAKDKANNQESSVNWSFSINTTELTMDLASPENKTYNTRRIPINVTLSKNALIEKSINELGFSTLCSDCDNYFRNFMFREGWNNITVKATNGLTNIVTETRNFLVDTRSPVIRSISPKNNEYVNGTDFSIKYNENYLKDIVLHYREVGAQDYINNTWNHCTSGNNQECSKLINLNAYNGKQVEFYFTVNDNINSADSRTHTINVDTTNPQITNLISPVDAAWYGNRRVYITVDFDEKVTLEASINGRRARRLCRECSSYNRTLSFTEGYNNITIIATDKSNNKNTDFKEFYIDSRAPRIRTVFPKDKTYVNGTAFGVTYTEDNLKNIILHYREVGAQDYINDTWNNCTAGINQECTREIPLDAFDGKQVEFYFTVNDEVNSADSRTHTINVDKTKPQITITSPEDGKQNYMENIIYIIVNTTETVKTLEKSENDETYRTLCRRCNSTIKRDYFKAGDYNIKIRAEDYSGNKHEEEVNFKVI